MRIPLILLITSICAAFAQEAAKKATFEQRPSLVLSNDKLELMVLPQGAALANLILHEDSEKLSPFWNPIRFARELGQSSPDPFTLGHFVCVDGFGPVSEEEKAAGMPGHGEAHRLTFETRFSRKENRTATLTLRANLPMVEEVLTRTMRLVDGENIIYVQSELENLMAFDRPVCWAEHATIGSPFLEPGVTVVDMSARRAKTRQHSPKPGPMPFRLASFKDFTWPMAPGINGKKIDVRAAPNPPNSGDHTTCLMDPDRKFVFVTALHPGKHLLLGYVFKPEEYPWTQNWENYPSNLKMARGLEFSTQPFDVPRREAIQTNTMFDTPVYRWLSAKSKIESRFLLFYVKTPEGFQKVDDVRFEGGKLVIEDRRAKKQITLAASLPM